MHGLPRWDTSQRTLRARQDRHAFAALFRDLWASRGVDATDATGATGSEADIEAIMALRGRRHDGDKS